MTRIVYYTETAPAAFQENYSKAKTYQDNYARAQVATDFIASVTVAALGLFLASYRDDISVHAAEAVSIFVALIPIIDTALTKLYTKRGEAYAKDVENGKFIGYGKEYLFKQAGVADVVEVAEQEETTSSDATSASAGSSSTASGRLSRIDMGEVLDEVAEHLGEPQNRDNIAEKYNTAAKYLKDKMGVNLVLNRNDKKIAVDSVERTIELYKVAKKLNTTTFDSTMKTLGGLLVAVLGFVGFVMTEVNERNDAPSDKLNDWVSGIDYAILGVPVLAALFIFARVGFISCAGPDTCCGGTSTTLEASFKDLKTAANDSGLFAKPGPGDELPVANPVISLVNV